jgi:hypothetical protein
MTDYEVYKTQQLDIIDKLYEAGGNFFRSVPERWGHAIEAEKLLNYDSQLHKEANGADKDCPQYCNQGTRQKRLWLFDRMVEKAEQYDMKMDLTFIKGDAYLPPHDIDATH